MTDFHSGFTALSAAEDFFQYLGVPYDPRMVAIKRLHILKSFNERLARLDLSGLDDGALRDAYAAALTNAYNALTGIEAREARLFKVFRQGPARSFVPLDAVGR
ncbi:MAG: nitrogenase-stabilizing/protective protein NifW [Rhodospirillaceae bacterium]